MLAKGDKNYIFPNVGQGWQNIFRNMAKGDKNISPNVGQGHGWQKPFSLMLAKGDKTISPNVSQGWQKQNFP